MASFDFGMATSIGAREYQEDSAATWPGKATFDLRYISPTPPNEAFIAVLADGMGGHVGGAIASELVCRAFLAAAGNCESHNVGNSLDLMVALEAADGQIARMVCDQPKLEGMGTTMIGVVVDASGIRWVSVGDSPLYHFRKGSISQINEDHSLAPLLDELARKGEITEVEARADGRRHVLRAALTGDGLEMVDLVDTPRVLAAGDVVILASDGVQTLEEGDIAEAVSLKVEKGAQAIADQLIEAVDARCQQYQDNTTVVAIRV